MKWSFYTTFSMDLGLLQPNTSTKPSTTISRVAREKGLSLYGPQGTVAWLTMTVVVTAMCPASIHSPWVVSQTTATVPTSQRAVHLPWGSYSPGEHTARQGMAKGLPAGPRLKWSVLIKTFL